MNKFKVGERVQIIALPSVNIGGIPEDIVGCYGTVEGVRNGINPYTVFVFGSDVRCWNFSEDCLQLALVVDGEKGIKSDGGSSDYYFTKLPQELIDQIVKTGGIEVKDIARYVYDNNADAFNIIKAQKRIIEANKGVGKAGITKLYDAKKISFFANEQYEAIKREGTNE